MFNKTTKWLISAIITLVVLTACQKESTPAEQAANSATEPAASQSVTAVTPDAGTETETEALNAWLDERYEESHRKVQNLRLAG